LARSREDLDVNTDDQIDNGDSFNPEVLSHNDYYAFGQLMPGRQYNSSTYRYGFNGKENDNEVKGTGNEQDYGMRVYDPRIGKFLSVDPLAGEYSAMSPYHFSHNSPIKFNDLDGKEGEEKAVAEAAKESAVIVKNAAPELAKKALEVAKSGGMAFVKNVPKTAWYTAIFRGAGIWFTRANIFITFMSFRGDTRASQETLDKERLEKLEKLHQEGAIDEDEAAELKTLLAKVKGVYVSDLGIYYRKVSSKDSYGNTVEDRLVDTKNDLALIGVEYISKYKMKHTKTSEDGSEWYEGQNEKGERIQMEYSPKGHPQIGEGAHIKINKWDPNKGSKGKGGFRVSHKYKVNGSTKW
jgi:RHS repeat-associated protein